MPTEPRRVALLARPGAAHDRLRTLLDDAGVACVLDADPTTSGVGALVDAAPQVVVVALDAATEDVLERFDGVLGNASVDVIFEEADSVVAREGWDAARWQRHLVAKLQGHANVLPPVPIGEDEAPGSIALPDDGSASLADIAAEFAHTPDEAVEEAVADAVAGATGHAIDASLLDGDPVEDALEPFSFGADIAGAGLVARVAEPDAHPFDPVADYEFNDAPLAAAVEGLGLEARSVGGAGPFDPVEAEGSPWEAPAEAAVASELGEFDPAAFDAAPFDPAAFDASAFDTSAFEAAGFNAAAFDPAPIGRDGVPEPHETAAFDAPANVLGFDVSDAMPVEAPAAPSESRGGLELSLDDGSGSYAPESAAASGRFRHDLDALHARISSLELVDDTPRSGPEQARGAVLVLAGIGGPDAVRQLLGALPEDFPRPVLVQQRLDGGRYDKLVAQMQRATTLAVRLAEPGGLALAGMVYILPDTVGIASQGASLRFIADGGSVIGSLPAADSAVLMFSGSDAALVDAAMNHSWSGALVAGQSPDGCYDATAPAALVARGAEAGQPAELAGRLAARWTH